MPQSSHRSMSDRNLLFGILAVQMSFISRDDLVTGLNSWVHDKDAPLGQILEKTGKLKADQVRALDDMLAQFLQAHGNNVAEGLRALPGASTVASWLTPIGDADIQASVAVVAGEAAEVETKDYVPPSIQERYRKVQKHDDGGQGIVWTAYDAVLGRGVALKEIKPDHATDGQIRNRFVAEAQVTSQLEHPGVVPIHDLAHADGQPFYTMRFLAGGPLSQAIRDYHTAGAGASRTQFQQLLRRFIDVCNTVAYAHSRGVLHRDLKPKNIMLGKFGETLVIDWGMTKTGVEIQRPQSPTDESPVKPGVDLEQTLPGTLKGTIPYMSPEQAHRRLDLDKTSDIYSLGSIFYEILTGRRAYVSAEKDKEAARKETEELVKAGRFTPPIQLKPDVPAALNAICLQAMAFKMSDRYASAQDLSADIEHWLADEPVSAYREPWNARLARWERRHPKTVAGVAGALAVALVLAVLGAVALGAEQRRTAAQKQIAEENFVVAREQLFGSIDLIETAEVDFATVPALHARRRALLAAATRACRQALEKNPDDPEMRKRSAMVFRYSANLYRLVEETASADKLYRDALRLYEKLAEEEKETLDQRSRLAETLRDYSSLQFKVGKLSAGTGNLERALRIVKAFPADEQKLPFRRLTLATILNDQAAFLYALGKDAESRRLLDEGTAILSELVALPAGKGHPYDPVLLAGALNRLAVSERDAGRLNEARKLHDESNVLLEDLLERRPPRVVPSDVLNFRALCRLEQARTLMKTGDPQARKAAEINLGKAAKQWEALATNYGWVPLYRDLWGSALRTRGQLRLEEKNLEPARADLEQAVKILDELVKVNPTLPSYRANLGQAHAAIGRLERAASRPAEADKAFAEADKELEQAVKQSPDHLRHQQALKEVRAEKAK